MSTSQGVGVAASVRYCGAAAAVVLVLLGVQHLVWMFSSWPLSNREALARYVGGVDTQDLPGAGPAAAVVGLLLLAGYLVGAGCGALPLRVPRPARFGVGSVGVVLVLRGVSGMVASGRAALEHRTRVPIEYVHGDLALSSPPCLALGAVAAAVAWRGRWPAAGAAGKR
jgi:hypothetical protein